MSALVDGGWLAPGAIVVVEESAKAQIDLPPNLLREDERRYGDTQFVFARYLR